MAAGGSWVDEVALALREGGFRVSVKRVEYRALTGGVVSEVRVVGFREDAKVVVSVSRGLGRVHVSVPGGGPAGALEDLGASVDEDEAGLVAVFRGVPPESLGRLVGEIVGLLD